MKNFLLKVFGRKAFQPFFEKLHWIALKGMNYGSANSPQFSGEIELIKELRPALPQSPIIFDVGANTGQYAKLLLGQLADKNPQLHLFEPDPKAYGKLITQFKDQTNVIVNNSALGGKEDEFELYTDNAGAVDASLVKVPGDNRKSISVSVHTLDAYCQANKIERIDFLKIDTEGFEIEVLRGAKNLIDRDAIDFIQLEHGSLNSIIMGASIFAYRQLLPNFEARHIKQDGSYLLKNDPRFEIYYNSNYLFRRI